jgi:hypothetical protein
MKNKIFLTVLTGSILLLCGCNSKNLTTDLSPYYGVWANADCELVQTEKYTLFFERNNSKISATLRQNKRSENGDTVYSHFFAGFIFDMQTKEYEKIVPATDNVKIPIDNYINLNNGQLKVLQSAQVQILQLIEKLDVCLPYEMPFAGSTNIGKCLQNWQMGVFEHSADAENPYIEIGTNKHSYIFTLMPNMLYCRAARIRHNNHGSVFAQNIRLKINANSGEKTAEMAANNLTVSAADVEIDNLLFKPNACSFEEGGIYWSFISCKPDKIKLNGCGETYTYNRPTIDNKAVVEWFAYKNY